MISTDIAYNQLRTEVVSRLQGHVPKNIDKVLSSFSLNSYKKKDLLLEEGRICNDIYFIVQGDIQVYYFDANEILRTRDLLSVNEWCCSLDSFLNDKPSNEYIKCLSPVIAYSISKSDFVRLVEVEKYFMQVFQKIVTDLYIEAINRIQFVLSLSAIDRINWIYENRIDLVRKHPSNLIATYLHLNKDVYSRNLPLVRG